MLRINKKNVEWLINTCLFFVTVFITLLFIEVFLRFSVYKTLLVDYTYHTRYYYTPDQKAGYDIQKNFPKTFSKHNEIPDHMIWSNNIGCFDNDYAEEKEFLLLVGDSFTFSYVPFNNNFGNVIENSLRYRTLKCGVPGYGTKQEYIKTKRILENLESFPKLIILVYTANDMMDDYLFPRTDFINGYPTMSQSLADFETGEIVQSKISEKELNTKVANWRIFCGANPSNKLTIQAIQWIKCFLTKHSIVYNLVKKQIKKIIEHNQTIEHFFTKFRLVEKKTTAERIGFSDVEIESGYWEFDDYSWLKQAWIHHTENLSSFKKLSMQKEIQLLVVYLPYKEQLYPFFIQNKDLKSKLPATNKRLRNFMINESIHFLDLTPMLLEYVDLKPSKWLNPKKDLYWSVDGHPNIKGNKIIGLLISMYLLENNLIETNDKTGKLEAINETLNKYRN